MSKSIKEYKVLPNEILEKIFVYSDINKIKQLNKDWNNFANYHQHRFNKINIDLLSANITELKKINPIKINVTCSRIYDIEQLTKEINDKIIEDETSPITNMRLPIYKSLEEENKILKKIKTRLNVIRKYSSLETINAKFDLINFSDDMEKLNQYFIRGGVETNHIGHNTLSVFCIKLLLKSKAKNIHLTINNVLCDKINDRFFKYYSNRYEYNLKNFLIRNAHSFDKFVYNGTFNMFLLYDKSKRTFIHRVSDRAKYDNDSYLIRNYIKPSYFYTCDLSHLIIYNNFIDRRFRVYSYNIPFVNRYYYYFVEKNSIYLNLFENSNIQSFNRELIEKSNCKSKDLIIKKFNKENKWIDPFNLIIQDNNKGFDLKNTMLKIFKDKCPFYCCD